MASSARRHALRLSHRLRPGIHWVAGVAGAVLICAGVAVLFATDREARSAFLIGLGVALLLFALLRGRVELEGFEILGAKVRVRDVVKRRLELAGSPARADAPDAAAWRRQAGVLQQLVGLYGLYEHVRRAEPASARRTATLDRIAAQMRAAGRDAEFDPSEVIGWFHQGTDALRVVALNLMLANGEYRDFLAVLETIDAPHSLFEQYYGLLLADQMVPELDPLRRGLLRDAIARAQRKRRFRRDASLPGMSRHVLDRLGD